MRAISLGTGQSWLGKIGGLVALWLIALLGSPAFAETAVERHGNLRVSGNRIVDRNGDPVVLRGMSLFWSQWQPRFYNAELVRWLRDDWKVTIIRAAMGIEPDGYLKNPEQEKKKVQAVIDAAIDLGIYVIVDWHAHEPHTAEAAEFFDEIARKYGKYPNVIYETWNEPLLEHDWKQVIKPHHEKIIARIRAHDPDNLIVAGTQTWSTDVDKAAADPLPFSNVAYTLHFYAGTHGQPIRDKAKIALDAGVALMVTEWGTREAYGVDFPDEVETRRWWTFLEENQVGYVNWSVTDKIEPPSALKWGASATGSWPDEMLTASGKLVREHLRTTNGAAAPVPLATRN
jgi:endoglucanase